MSELPAVSVEMSAVLEGAREAGDSTIEGKALTALAEVALLREGDLPKATELVDAALEALPEEGRFGALEVRGRIAWWVGDFETQERLADEALEIAQRLERKDLEAQALSELAGVYRHLQPAGRGGGDDPPRARARRGERQHRRARAGAALARHAPARARARRELGEEQLEEARSLFAEVGDAWMLGRTLNSLAWAASRAATTPRRERRLREAIRLLKPLEDRGALCESQRALAEVLIRRGRLDEAERLALEAIETVGEHDSQLAGDDDDVARARARGAGHGTRRRRRCSCDALALVDATGFRGLEVWVLTRLEEFLRSRGRERGGGRLRASAWPSSRRSPRLGRRLRQQGSSGSPDSRPRPATPRSRSPGA